MSRVLTFSVVLCLTAAMAGSVAANGLIPGAGNQRFNVKVKSLVDMRFKKIVRQQYDLSCGAAAMATLLQYFYGDDTDEQAIIEGIFEFGDKQQIEKFGFSMLELKQFGERAGYVTQGYKINDVNALTSLEIPVLTLTNTRGYNHFVVIKGIKDGQVFIADPAYGNRSESLETFEDGWNNVILAVLSSTNQGDNTFSLDPKLKAPRDQVKYLINRSLFEIRPGANEF